MSILGELLLKGLTVAGKEIGKKTIYIAGGVAGSLALAGGGAAYAVHKKHKNDNIQEVKPEEDNESAEQVEGEVVDSPETKSDDTNTESKITDITELVKESTEKDPADQAPVEEAGAEKVDHIEETVAPQSQIQPISMPQNMAPFPFMNPGQPGPNPVFQMMGNTMAPGMQTGGITPFPFPVSTEPDPIQVSETVAEQPNNQVEEVKQEEEVKEEKAEESAIEEDLKDESVVLTAMDMATGKKPSKKKGKTKSVAVELPEVKVNVPKKKK